MKRDKFTLPLFPRTSEWVPPQSFPDLSTATEIAIDLETCDPNLESMGPGWPRNDGYIVGYAVAVDGWSGYYPVAHAGGGNLDKRIVERWVKDVLATPADKVMHNATYDAGWLRAAGFDISGRIYDTMLAAPLLDENRFGYSLNALGFDYLKQVKSEQGLRDAAQDFGVHPKKELWKLPAMYVGEYAEQDASLTLKLWHHFRALLRREEVESIFELETDVLPVLLDITFKGIRFDRSACEAQIEQMRRREAQLLSQAKEQAGVKIDIWAAASIAIAFDKLGIPYPRTAQGAASFTKTFLENHDHPLAKMIVQARELNKTHGTFLEPYLRHSLTDGRIHPHINQLRSEDGGTVTGRLCVHGSTLLETSRGTFRIDEYKPTGNDFILTHRNRYRRILRKFLKGTENMFRVSLENGATITCTLGHQMLTKEGWKALNNLRIGDEVFSHDNFKSAPVRRRTGQKSSPNVCFQTEAHFTGTGRAVFNQLSHCYGNGPTDAAQGANYSGETIAILPWQGWAEEPNVWKDHNSAPELQGPDWGWQRLLSSASSALVYLKARIETRVFPPRGVLPSGRNDGGSCGIYRAPHRWESGEQRHSQLDTGDDARACPYPLSKIREIHPVGEACVWDIEVEEDHSYVAGGIVHHNSMNSPNLQQVPSRHEIIGPLVRSLFLPEEDQEWAALDFSSQEPRLLVHYANLLSLPGADKVVEAYNSDPSTDFYQIVAKAAGVPRKVAKLCTLGIMYGMGKAKLANSLDLPLDEAAELIATFHRKVPFLKGTVDAVMKRIEHPASGGAIRTLLGRKCRFPLWEPVEWGVNKALPREQAVVEYGPRIKRAGTYKGLNRLIQGSAADQTKAAMVALHKAGFDIRLQVHDEIALSVRNREEAREAADIMQNAVRLEIPSRVDIEVGRSWGEAV